MTATLEAEPVNPFPGPQPYRSADRRHFHGREDVGRDLADTIIARRCVVLYGPSGAGKSSVMRAAVIPRLAEEYDVRHVTIDGWPMRDPPVDSLLYALSAQLKLATPPAGLGTHDSVEWAITRTFRRSDRPVLLYLDQIEQLLLPHRVTAEVVAFLDWLDRFCESPLRGLHLVLAMREDYLGRFRDRARGLHRLLEHGFRLGPLTVREIVGAVCRAAADGTPPQLWSPEALRPLMLQVRTPGQSPDDHAEIQAAFAQIVCRTMFAQGIERARRGAPAAEPDSVYAEPILHEYLDSTLAGLGSLRTAVLELLENHLIAADGSRALLTEEEARTSKLFAEGDLDGALARLEQAAILRAEEHRGSRYFELGHDWLARKIFERKQERQARERELAQQQALVEEQRKAEEKLAAARREARRARVALLVGLFTLAMGVVAMLQWRAAVRAKGVLFLQREAARQKQEVAEAAEHRASNAVKQAQEASEAWKKALVEAEDAKTRAVGERWKADQQRASAVESETKAQLAEENSRRAFESEQAATKTAVEARASAEVQRDAATRERDASRLEAAQRVMLDDPTTALGLLREIKDPAHTRNWTSAVVEALQRPVSKAVVREHGGHVVAAVFSPDGRWIATASHDRTARITRIDGSQPPIVIDGHTDKVIALAFNHHGVLATASADGTARLRREDGSMAVLREHSGPLTALAFSPDGTRLATASRDTVLLWAVDDPRKPAVLAGHAKAVRAVTFRDDGKALVSSSDDGTARVWMLDGPRVEAPIVLSGHHGTVHHATFSPGRTRVATASDDRMARIWRLDGARPGQVFHTRTAEPLEGHHGAVYSVEFSPDGSQLVTASADHTARIWTTRRGEKPRVLHHEGKVYVARFDPTGETVATVSRDGKARLWPADGRSAPQVLRGHTGPVVDVAFSPVDPQGASSREAQVVTAAEDGTARVWDVAPPGHELVLRGHRGAVHHVGFVGGGSQLVTADDRSARLWTVDKTTASASRTLATHRGKVLAVAMDDAYVYTGSADGTVQIRRMTDLASKLDPLPLGLHGIPNFVTFSRDRRKLLTSATDTAKVMTIEGRTHHSSIRHAGVVLHAAFNHDGTRVVTASQDHTARLWNADGSGTAKLLLKGEHSLTYAAFSDDGSKVVIASWDGAARIVSVSGVEPMVVLQGTHKPMRSAEFSHDGQRVVTTSNDGTATVWSVDGHDDPVKLYGHEKAVLHAAFSPDSRRVVTGSSDGTARVWDVDFSDLEKIRARLQKTATVCLTLQQRRKLLGEGEQTATVRQRECEDLRGRAKPP
ncbi:hypothetical protein [Nannocystis sp. SCPEA4]|uniref:nSTAND1 domain-containing NTPase n=1 Tax=Nannocystis sp. SCPEA4 TaxID=2996787 RepID=UPI0022720380|nr:hypothetical protein [Nannocystis sp. SCPEA4]MCY1061762.1 hypothetical protein [Nannocystis sp. SCPEA4]